MVMNTEHIIKCLNFEKLFNTIRMCGNLQISRSLSILIPRYVFRTVHPVTALTHPIRYSLYQYLYIKEKIYMEIFILKKE